jgi:prepilin-type N-terminal cleavage/methylation domain-containing protein
MDTILTKKGFTLVELMIVITLFCIAVGLVTVSVGDRLPVTRLHAAGRDLASVLRQAQTLTQIRGKTHAVVIDLDQRVFGIQGHMSRPIPGEISMEVTDPVMGAVSGGRHRVTFRPAGDHESAVIVLRRGTQSVTVKTDPVVGSVVVRDRP